MLIKNYCRWGYRRKVGKFMKLKKILFSVFCAAILLCTGVVCLASASDGTVSTMGTSTYNDGDVTYNTVRLRAFGNSSVPASITQITNPSTTKTDYYGEVDVSRYNPATKKYEDTDGDNAIVYSGKVLTGQVGQIRSGIYRYEHSAILHIGTVSVSPIAASLEREYTF